MCRKTLVVLAALGLVGCAVDGDVDDSSEAALTFEGAGTEQVNDPAVLLPVVRPGDAVEALPALVGPQRRLTDEELTGKAPYEPGRVIVRLDAEAVPEIERTLDPSMFRSPRPLVPRMNLYLVPLVSGVSVPDALRALRGAPGVRYAQADHLVTERNTYPNDPQFWRQWGLQDVGQNILSGASPSCLGFCGSTPGGGCYCDATCVTAGDCCGDACIYCGQCGPVANGPDIDAVQAWDNSTGTSLAVIAIIDNGFDFDHEDFVGNRWSNAAEVSGIGGVDDDGNGYVDDKYGWDAYNHDGSIETGGGCGGGGHGTHVAGIAAAQSNNGTGTSGVSWNARLMFVPGSGNTSTVSEAYGFVIAHKDDFLTGGGPAGANVLATNSSFGVDYADCNTVPYPVWNDLYNEMGSLGILSAVAAPNLGVDVDAVGDVPSGCSSQYTVAVTRMDRSGQRNPSAGYGDVNIDVAAPGTDIYSTLNDHTYGWCSGTSMATPHVAGAIAVMHTAAPVSFQTYRTANPASAAQFIKLYLLDNVVPVASMATEIASGGRLNLFDAVEALEAFTYCETANCDDDDVCTTNGCSYLDGCFFKPGSSNCCAARTSAKCEEYGCVACVCALDPYCCANTWDIVCAGKAKSDCAASCTCPECGDSNTCTLDGCDPETGCYNWPQESDCCSAHSGTSCEEPACAKCVCTADPYCCGTSWDGVCASRADTGSCSGVCTCYDCSDGNECTADICASPTGCQNVAGSSNCCTAKTTAGCSEPACVECVCDADPYCCNYMWDNACVTRAKGECAGPCSCGDCSDGDVCTVGDECAGSTCVGTGPADCADGNECTTDSCNAVTGCYNALVPSNCCAPKTGVGCEEPACEFCVCAGDAFCCDSGWDQLCANDASGSCAAVCSCGGACDDGNACTSGDTCTDGVCVGTEVDCDDANACTWNGCDPLTGCVFPPGNSNCCASKKGPGCEEEACKDCVCTADASCCLFVWDASCAALANGKTCDSVCTCEAVCPDANPCTADACDAATGCESVPAPADCCSYIGPPGGCQEPLCVECVCAFDSYCCQTAWDTQCAGEAAGQCANACTCELGCDDGSLCTVDDTCTDGVCVGAPKDCNDGNPCTQDGCIASVGCVYVLISGPCNDGDPCTTGDLCLQGECVGAPKDCSDGNPCTTDSCNSVTGACVHKPLTGISCDDGNLCTLQDTCQLGACVGTPKSCADLVACTVDTCTPATGVCVHTPNPGLCDDGNPCTADTCDAKTGCGHAPLSSVPCEDGNGCTVGDLCLAGTCKPGKAKDCSDGIACTVDSCIVPSGVCAHAPMDSLCDDGNVCTLDTCVITGGAGGCVYEPSGLPGCEVDICAIAGDLNDDGTTNVTDVQCGIIVGLWVQGGSVGEAPACLQWPAAALDMNCDLAINVTDLILIIQTALGAPFDPTLDADQDGCVDACE
jgi:subtilisin family serine protease